METRVGVLRQEAVAILRASGLRATAPRVALLKALWASTRPLSVAEISKLLKEMGGDRVTIYRNLLRLVELDLARSLPQADGTARYVARESGDEASGLIEFQCRVCERLTAVRAEFTWGDCPSDWQAALSISEAHAFGICPDCRCSK